MTDAEIKARIRDDHILLFDNASGVYLPQRFAREIVRDAVSGVSDWAWTQIETGPDAEFYWDAWTEVLDRASVKDGDKVYSVHQDGDVWLIPNDWTEEEWNAHFE